MRSRLKNRRRRRAPGGRLDRPPSVTGRGGFRPGVNARRYSACCEARISSRCRGNWGSRRRGPPNGVTSSWPRARRGCRAARRMPGMRSTSDCTPRSASCSWRTSCSTRRSTTWRPAALWLGGGRRDEWRPVDLRPSGVRRTTGLPRVGTGAVQRLRATARDAVARLTAPPRTRCWSATSAGCSKPHRFMAKGTGKRGRSCGSRGSAPRRNGCDG